MEIEEFEEATVVGAGPVGCVLATLLARRGVDVTLFEKRPDMRRADIDGGRSINLVLTDRGLRALDRIGLRDRILDHTVPVRGRMMHSTDGEQTYQPYGKDASECNYSVSRGRLNELLLDTAEDTGVEIHFEHAVSSVDFDANRLSFGPSDTGEEIADVADYDVVFGCDGAPSALRKALVERGDVDESVVFMEWGYKELRFPAGDDGSWPMQNEALHIWPRGEHFLMGLANPDGSFTGTIYLARRGDVSFEALDDEEAVRAFFDEYYTTAVPYLGDYVEEFLEHPTGSLGTVRAAPWYLDGQVLLVGDAAHGIVPFFGQGLNSGFEDCVVLDDLLADGGLQSLEDVFEAFYQRRKPNTDAIADMALENAVEMGEKVADADFLLQKEIEERLEQTFDDIYRSRYATVMYSTIPYAVAFEAGEIQQEILAELAAGVDDAADVDLDEARKLIDERLTPIYERHDVTLDF